MFGINRFAREPADEFSSAVSPSLPGTASVELRASCAGPKFRAAASRSSQPATMRAVVDILRGLPLVIGRIAQEQIELGHTSVSFVMFIASP
jgi:hypothetical protein